MQNIFNLFMNLGLSKSEAKIYLAALSLGPSPVQEIAKKARLSRTATYETIGTLKERGLISTHEQGKKTMYSAESPERIEEYFKESVEEMKNDLKTLKTAMPSIKKMAGGEQPRVRFYEGEEAIYSLYSDLGRKRPKILRELSNMDAIVEFMDKEVVIDAKRKSRKVEEIRLLHSGKLTLDKKENVKYREVPKGTPEFNGDIWIYSNRVALISYVGKMIVVIVENKTFTETLTALFDAAWIAGKK